MYNEIDVVKNDNPVHPDHVGAGPPAGALSASYTADAPAFRRFQVIRISDTNKIPLPDYLVGSDATDAIVPADSLTVLHGRESSGKTFVALDIAYCIAAGVRWHGYPTTQGSVVYVIAEGLRNIRKRTTALLRHYKQDQLPQDFHIVASAVQLLDTVELDELIREILLAGVQPALVVFDTLACCMVGAEENGSKDMGIAVHNAGFFQKRLGTAVMLVHHGGKNGDLRGSSVLRGAADKIIKVAKDRKAKNCIEVSSVKTKDDDEFKTLKFVLKTISLDDIKPGLTTCVVVDRAHENYAPGESGPVAVSSDAVVAVSLRLTKNRRPILQAFDGVTDGLTNTEALRICSARGETASQKPMSKGVFQQAIKDLEDCHYLQHLGKKGTRGVKIAITESGRDLLHS